MLDKITKALTAIGSMNFRNVVIIFLLCTIGLGTFYTYRKIDTLEFKIDNKTLITPRDKYFEEFGLESLQDDLAIRDILVETRLVSGASSTMLWGYHNGVSVGPFPFKKVSILDESVNPGSARLARVFQDMPLNLYIDLTVAL